MSCPVVHFEIGCRDAEETKSFYQTVFGWSISDHGQFSKSIDARGAISGHLTALGHEPHNYVMIYIECEDVTASIEAVKRAGGEVFVGPLPEPGGKTFAWIKDTAGNMVGLISKPE